MFYTIAELQQLIEDAKAELKEAIETDDYAAIIDLKNDIAGYTDELNAIMA